MQPRKDKRIRLGFHSWGYGSMFSRIPSYPLEETIRRIAKIGYDGIEIGAARPHAWPPDLSHTKRGAIREALSKYGLEVSAICPSNENLNLASPFPQERAEAAQHYEECVQLAYDLKVPITIFVPGWRIYGTTYSQAWKWTTEGIKPALELAEKLGILLALEAVNSFRNNLVNRSDQAMEMVERVASSHMKLMLDTIHVFLEGENPVDVVKSYGEGLVHVHCVDALKGIYERKVPGQGEFGFESFLGALKEIAYSGYLSVEVWNHNPDQLARESFQFLNKLLAEEGRKGR